MGLAYFAQRRLTSEQVLKPPLSCSNLVLSLNTMSFKFSRRLKGLKFFRSCKQQEILPWNAIKVLTNYEVIKESYYIGMFIAKGFHSDCVGTHQLQIALCRFCTSLNYTNRISIFCLKIRLFGQLIRQEHHKKYEKLGS